jgi:DNA helicase II / ATP-dependent DNA helicase PcrA
MAMISKYNNICLACNVRIVAGRDWIEPRELPGKGKKWVHVQCPTEDHSALGTSVKTASNYKSGHNVPVTIDKQIINFIDTCQSKENHLEGIDCLWCGGNHFDIIDNISDAIASAIESSLLDEPVIEKTFIPSVYQQAIFDAITSLVDNVADFKHLVIEAVAGSGKTTTIEQSLKLIPMDYIVRFLAFNKHIATELDKRCQRAGLSNVTASTLHSLGLSNFKRTFPKFNSFQDIEDDKVGFLLESIYPVSKKSLEAGLITKDERKVNYVKRDGMRKIVSLAKNTMVDYHNPDAVKTMIDRYNVEVEEKLINELTLKLPDVMQMCIDYVKKIDYDDMIWLPIVLGLDLEKFDFLMVDEAQDLNALQIQFILRSIKEDGHIIAVGDRHQSLYAFRGADAQAIPNIIKALDAKTLPLSVTYRCPASHVRQAQEIVPHLEARENAPEGTIIDLDYFELAKKVQSGDMVICRTNGPLVRPAFECIRMGKKAVIRGKDIGATLIQLIKRFETDDLDQFEVSLMEYYEVEHSKLMNYGKEMKALLLQDRVETLRFIMNECRTVSELQAKIEMLFSDKQTGVIFSSVHRAKGLEAENVYILRPDLMPHPRANKDWEVQQEMNCKYVAETRSKNTLVYVKGGEDI